MIKDDPSRTADYGYFPWESDAEIGEVSVEDSVIKVIEAIANKESLLEFSPEQLIEILVDAAVEDAEGALKYFVQIPSVQKACWEIVNKEF